MEKNTLDWVALILVIIGGVNWGLIGLFSFDLVSTIVGYIPYLGTFPWVLKIIYILVGLSAVYMIYFINKE